MDDPAPLSLADAKKRYFAYLAIKLMGLFNLFGGVILAKDGMTIISGLMVAAGLASLFLRPRQLGLTNRRKP
jgi:hypothetical protein